jgi:tetratricopeptide (TPR) repeat protein
VLALTSGSLARGAEPSTAEALFREGRELLARGDYAAACPKLEESQRLDPAPGTEFNLGRCYELLGRLASAWGAYADVAQVTHSFGQKERELRARERVAAIEPRLSFVLVKAASHADGLHLRRDGAPMPLAQLDVEIPVDPGDHVLAAEAPGKRPWEAHFRISHEAERVVVEVPLLEPAPPEADAASPPLDGATPLAQGNEAPLAANAREAHLPAPVSLPTSGGTTQRAIAVALLGSSLVAAGFGTYFGIERIDLGNQLKTAGPNASAQYDSANLDGYLSTGTFIASGVLALAGGITWFTAPRTPKTPPVARLGVRLNGAGVVVMGAW